MADTQETEPATTPEPEPEREPEPELSEDDRRAAAATANRKRALDDWEAKKKLWRQMGVPPAMPAKK